MALGKRLHLDCLKLRSHALEVKFPRACIANPWLCPSKIAPVKKKTSFPSLFPSFGGASARWRKCSPQVQDSIHSLAEGAPVPIQSSNSTTPDMWGNFTPKSCLAAVWPLPFRQRVSTLAAHWLAHCGWPSHSRRC